MRRIRRSVSTRLRPAAGSSSSSTDGAGASAMARPRSRCSPHERLRAASPALWASPTKSRMAGRARRAAARPPRDALACAARAPARPVRARRWHAVSALSKADASGKTLVRWNIRTSPSSAIRCGASPPMSRPAKVTRPVSAGWNPVITLNAVDLPAPFGPMRARISPGPSSRLTSCTAASPPKRTVTSRTASAGPPDAGEAFGPLARAARPERRRRRRGIRPGRCAGDTTRCPGA